MLSTTTLSGNVSWTMWFTLSATRTKIRARMEVGQSMKGLGVRFQLNQRHGSLLRPLATVRSYTSRLTRTWELVERGIIPLEPVYEHEEDVVGDLDLRHSRQRGGSERRVGVFGSEPVGLRMQLEAASRVRVWVCGRVALVKRVVCAVVLRWWSLGSGRRVMRADWFQCEGLDPELETPQPNIDQPNSVRQSRSAHL